MTDKKLFALRGATQCLNEREDVTKQVTALYDELLTANKLAEGDIVSVFFSVTGDLDAQNPAAALRQSGRGGDLALFALREADISGGLERVVRILIHCYLAGDAVPRHVYRNGAGILRPDRSCP
ncbi:MAG: chorismate mutase [Treponema sp.]|jgi:chorismate mutase|nr:chorismate mutase [Treponema sp.]